MKPFCACRQDGFVCDTRSAKYRNGWYSLAKYSANKNAENDNAISETDWEGIFYDDTRWEMATKSTDENILMLAIQDKSHSVRRAAALNNHATEKVLMLAAADPEFLVRRAAIRNINASTAVKTESLVQTFRIDDPQMKVLVRDLEDGLIDSKVVQAIIQDPRVDLDQLLETLVKKQDSNLVHPMWEKLIERAKMRRKWTPLVLLTNDADK